MANPFLCLLPIRELCLPTLDRTFRIAQRVLMPRWRFKAIFVLREISPKRLVLRIPDSERSQRIFDARCLLYSVKYFAARDCAPGPNTLTAALLPSSRRNKVFASFFSCSDTSA